MANYKTQAINLKSYNLGEADKIVVMYSRDLGIIRCVAKGIKKPTSKLGGRMELLASNKLLVAKGKKLDIVCQAELIDSFKGVRRNITNLTYAMYCGELVSTFGLEHDTNSNKIYDILFESLKNIALSTTTDEALWATIRFKLVFMDLLGYAVELNHCVKCNNLIKNSGFTFSAEAGGIVCKNCSSNLRESVEINNNILNIFKDAANFDFPENIIDQSSLDSCFRVLRDYVALRSHRKIKSLDLIECLC
jgi:DNA repair protein RecO (recombination protein O)